MFTPLWSQDAQSDRSARSGGSERQGGIPRDRVQADGDRTGRTEEGTEEGMPQLQRRESVGGDQRRGGAEPYLVPRPDRPTRGDWVLGVRAYNTETGVVATRVVPGSAASRTGLESGDRIVSVDGFQVGFVEDMLYPLGEELQRRAGRGGRVTLLIQNVRTRGLLNRTVDLDRRHRGRPPRGR